MTQVPVKEGQDVKKGDLLAVIDPRPYQAALDAVTALGVGVALPGLAAVDAAARLFVCLVSQHGGGPPLLARILGVTATVLTRDCEERGAAFSGRPYCRICIGLLSELGPVEAGDEAGLQYLQVSCCCCWCCFAGRRA